MNNKQCTRSDRDSPRSELRKIASPCAPLILEPSHRTAPTTDAALASASCTSRLDQNDGSRCKLPRHLRGLLTRLGSPWTALTHRLSWCHHRQAQSGSCSPPCHYR